MEATREIYWNVTHSVEIPMYILALIAISVMVYGFYKRIKLYKSGRPLNRTDNIFARVIYFLKNFILQLKVIRVVKPGVPHALFFWGFALLFIGTVLVFIQADFTDPLFHIKFLKGPFYKGFSLVLDIAGITAIVMMIGLFFRRFFYKPEGLDTIKDDYIMHFLIFAILITGFLIEGARMAVTELNTNVSLSYYSPVGLIVAKILSPMGTRWILTFHKVIWWIHFLFAATFIASIPFIKFRHIFTTSANYLFADRRPKGMIDLIDMEDEKIESFGVSKVEDFTWKDIFDADACTRCKRCQDVCPAYNTDKPLSPMKVILQIGEAAFNGRESSQLIDTITKDALWACTTCRACQEICPADIEHVNKIIEMRRNLVLMEGEFPGDEVMTAANEMEVNGNPFGLGFATRGDWAADLDVTIVSENSDVDLLYFVGCYASFDKRNIEIAKSFVKICNAAGIKVGILGKEEKCCGEPLRKLGNEYLYQMLAKENIEMFKKYNVKNIVTTCPHCFNTLKKDYVDLGLEATVMPYTIFIHNLINEGKISIEKLDFECTYHDSCYVGRYNDVFKQPREVIESAGGNITEMSKHHYESFCCGAGGGWILGDEKIGEKISVKRVNMAVDTGKPVLVSNCPFCLTMFEDGIKMADKEKSLKAYDLAEIVAERLK